MMKKAAALILVPLLCVVALAGKPPTFAFPPEVRPQGQYARLTPDTDAFSVVYVGLDGLEPIPPDLLRDSRTFLLDCMGKPPGRYRFAAVAANKAGDQVRSDFVLVIGDVPGPGPTPGPTPGPGPSPGPGPTPPDPPAPIPLFGFRVVIVEESEDRGKLPKDQREILFSQELRDYLNKHCFDRKGWGIWDKDDDVTAFGPEFVAAMKRPRTSLPWLIVSNGTTGYEGPLPATLADTLKLLKKYGGE